MNNRKLIFGIIGGFLVVILLILILIGKDSKKIRTTKASGNFQIWIIGDSSSKFEEFLTSFKEKNKSMSNVDYVITSFKNYEDYSLALNSSFIKGESPDIFVLNNNETSLFENKIYLLDNSEFDIYSFRQNYKSIFIDDLIVSEGEGEEKKEYLKGIPVGYETLGILYNARYRLKRSDFNTISSLKSAILKIKNFDIIPLAAGNGSTILDSGDLLAQQFLLNKVYSIKDSTIPKIKQTLAEYTEYGSISGDNKYNSLFENSQLAGKNNIDLFTDKEVGAIIAYPRVIEKLQSYGFSSKFLYASAYPHSYSGDGPTLANYNYFVISNESSKKNIAFSLLKYLNSDKGSESYLSKFKYYLPAKKTLEDKLGKEKISNFYPNIELRDFYSDEPLSSFDKGNKVIYDREINYVLDNFSSYISDFDALKLSILCKTEKILELKNLSISCE